MSASITDISDKEYDFVVIGGGTAGLVIAARLAEDSSISVAVLEAGRDNYKDFKISVSGQHSLFIGDPDYDWLFQTKPQQELNGNFVLWPRGRLLGGTSAVNFFGWMKPSVQDLDAWEKLGNPGWGWEALSPYYRKAENLKLLPNANSEEFKRRYPHEAVGTSGPVLLTVTDSIMEAENLIQETLVNAGVLYAKSPLNGDPVGAFVAPVSIDPDTFTRSSAATAYYEPNKGKPNFRVLCGARVNRIVKQDGNGDQSFKATAVEFEWNGEVHNVGVKKEVIVSAGTIKSPQILELSGIGNRDILEPLGITTHVHLPGVGTNLQDHYGTFTVCELTPEDKSTTLDMLNDPAIADQQRALFSENKGVYCGGIMRFAMIPFNSITPTSDEANEIVARQRKYIKELVANGTISEGLRMQYEMVLQAYESGKSGNCEFLSFPGSLIPDLAGKGKKYFSFICGINHAFSRGTVHIRSKDPKIEPDIDPRYLEAGVDLEILLSHLKFIRRMQNMEPLKSILVNEVLPGPSVVTDEGLEAHLKNTLTTIFHGTSTLSMLPRGLDGVVDPELRVYGTENIRVVDLSIVPLNIGAHTQSTAYAIGEKAADMIKADWKNKMKAV